MPAYEIPLGPSPRRMSMALAGITYNLRFAYADAPGGGWFMDIADADGVAIAAGIPMVTGADLLAQYAYLGLGGKLYVGSDGNLGAVPTFGNLGIGSHVWFEPN